MIDLLWTAAGLGLLSTLHCVAMCGPLAMAGCARDGRPHLRDALGYGAGRLVSYAFVGAAVGHFGHHLAHAISVERLQLAASLLVAAVALWQGVRLLRSGRQRSDGLVPPPSRRPKRARSWAFITDLVPRRGLGLGLITGVLPCGVLMAGWMLAASAHSAVGGAAVMAVFSLATLPGPLVPVAARRFASGRLPRLRPHWYGWAWCILAVYVGTRPFLMSMHGGH